MIPRRRAFVYPGEFAEVVRHAAAAHSLDTTKVEAWERDVARYVGVPHAAAVSSGRRGMSLIFENLGLRSGDEVIIPAYTLKDLIPLIERTGARVMPADIDPATLNITLGSAEHRITPRTKAILALHAFGSPCPIEEIVALAQTHGLKVIEDCAHSLGATVGHSQTGSFGYAGFFSFETAKPVNTFGGGMVVSRDEDLVRKVQQETANDVFDPRPLLQKVRATKTERALFATGLAFLPLIMLASPAWKRSINALYRRVQHAPPANVRYLPIQAQLGAGKLASLDERLAERRRNAELLKSLLRPGISVQRVADGCQATWYFFVVMLPCEAASVRRRLLVRGVDAAVEDEIADHCARLLEYNDCPNTDAAYFRAMALPMYDGIPESAIRKVARTLNEAVQ